MSSESQCKSLVHHSANLQQCKYPKYYPTENKIDIHNRIYDSDIDENVSRNK